MSIGSMQKMAKQFNTDTIQPALGWVNKKATDTGVNQVVSKVVSFHDSLPDAGREALNGAGGLYMMRLGFKGMILSYNEGPDLQFAKVLMNRCSRLETGLTELKRLHTDFDQARSEYEKVVAEFGRVSDSPKPDVAEALKDKTRGNFERELGSFKRTIQKFHERIIEANTQRTTPLAFTVGTKGLDIFDYWGEINDQMSTWVDNAEKMCKKDYKGLEFKSPIALVSREDGGRGHVLSTAVKSFRSEHSDAERKAPIKSSLLRGSLRVSSAATGAAGAYLFVRDGVMGLGGRSFSLCRAAIGL